MVGFQARGQFQAQWAIDEFAEIDLKNKRLNTRVVTIATQMRTIGESSPNAMKGSQQRAKSSPVTTGDHTSDDSNKKRARSAQFQFEFWILSASVDRLHDVGCAIGKWRLLSVPSVMTLNVVEVREPNPPEGEVAIHWILVTTLPIDTDERVAEIVAAYKVRWNIEVYFLR